MKRKNIELLFRNSFIVCVVASLAAVSGAHAESEERGAESFGLNEIVVTATKSERKIKDVASSVSVMDEVDIEALNADYVMDAISSLPGIYIRRDAIYGRQDIEMRGLGSNLRRLQVLVDGRPEKMSYFGCAVAQTLPLANLERIEVIRGPESVLYGSDAMGGVVNIITKKMKEPGYDTSALFSYGSYAAMHGLLRHGGKLDEFDYYLTYDHKQTDGHRPQSEYDADFWSARAGYDMNENWRVEASGQYFRDNAQDPGPENAPYTNDDRMRYKRYSWNASLLGQWDRSDFTLTVYDNEGEHDVNMPSKSDYWHSKDSTLGTLIKYSQTVYEGEDSLDIVTGGYEHQYQWAEPQNDWVEWAKKNMPAKFMDFEAKHRNIHSVFAMNEFRLGRWVNTLGVRGEYDDDTDNFICAPQAGLVCHVTDVTTARAKVARGYRQPRFNELHLFPAHNTELDPEDVWSYEVALSHEFAPWLGLYANPFYMDVRNLIQQEQNDAPPPGFINKNSGSFYIRGVETGLELKPLRELNIMFYYTLTDIEDGPDSNLHINRESKPTHAFNIVPKCTLGDFTLSLDMEYVAGLYDSTLFGSGKIEKVGDYFVMDVKASYQLSECVQLFGGIENLLDRDYEQIPGYTMPGISGHVGLKVDL